MARRIVFILSVAMPMCVPSAVMSQQSFSCSWGKEAACLDYGDVVCNSMAKCVERNAVCFDSYTCDYKGFICKSKFDEAVDEIDEKVRRYNELVNEYNNLNSTFETLKSEYDETARRGSELARCVERSSTLDEAKDCRL